jgi:hypothetical protein
MEAAMMPNTFSASDIVTIIVSVVALIVAVIALVLANRQVKLAKRQVTLAVEQTNSTERQEKISGKQLEIAEIQHKIMQEQLNRQSLLGVVIALSTTDSDTYDVVLLNRGNKTVSSVYVALLFPAEFEPLLRFNFFDQPVRTEVEANETVFVRLHSYISKPVFPDVSYVIGSVTVDKTVNKERFRFGWRIVSEDGRVPPDKTELVKLPHDLARNLPPRLRVDRTR